MGRRRQGVKLKFCKITVVLGLLNPELWFTKPVVRGLGGRSETGKRSVKREKGRGCRQQGRWIGTTFFSVTLWQQDQQIQERAGEFTEKPMHQLTLGGDTGIPSAIRNPKERSAFRDWPHMRSLNSISYLPTTPESPVGPFQACFRYQKLKFPLTRGTGNVEVPD